MKYIRFVHFNAFRRRKVLLAQRMCLSYVCDLASRRDTTEIGKQREAVNRYTYSAVATATAAAATASIGFSRVDFFLALHLASRFASDV